MERKGFKARMKECTAGVMEGESDDADADAAITIINSIV